MPKITKAQAVKLHNAQMLVFARADKVFDAASPRNDVPFLDCLKMASPDVRAAHAEALSALHAMESELLAQGRGYRDSYGHFKAYS